MKKLVALIPVLVVCVGLSACANRAQLNANEDCKKIAMAALPVQEAPAHPNDDFGACLISHVSSDTSETKISCQDLMKLSECEAKMQEADTSCAAFQFYKTYTCYKFKDAINDPPLPDQQSD